MFVGNIPDWIYADNEHTFDDPDSKKSSSPFRDVFSWWDVMRKCQEVSIVQEVMQIL